jgi:hypothetical protein
MLENCVKTWLKNTFKAKLKVRSTYFLVELCWSLVSSKISFNIEH